MIKIFLSLGIIILISIIFNYLQNILNLNVINKKENLYYKKEFMTQCELSFYNKLKELEKEEYKIVPQINLASIIYKQNKGFQNELFRNIDFAVFDKNFKNILLLIELNDSSHKKAYRNKRDLKVKQICSKANIKLITFYTNFPNEKEYILNRIKEEINKISTIH